MDLKLLNRKTRENIDILRDVIIFHCYSLLSAQNQRVACKLASQEYLGCTVVTSRCQGLFPPHPFFEEKALGTRLHIVDRPHQLATEANMLNKHYI